MRRRGLSGVDDFALRRLRGYGTVIADLETHTIIDLLPDRTATMLAAWLRQQPQIEIVSRDRSTEYAHGIDQGAPQAQQVADRWQILRNLREAGERLLDAHRVQWQDITLPDPTDQAPPVRRSRQEQAARQAGRRQRQERYDQVRALHAPGLSLRCSCRYCQITNLLGRRVQGIQWGWGAGRIKHIAGTDEEVGTLSQSGQVGGRRGVEVTGKNGCVRARSTSEPERAPGRLGRLVR